MNEVSTGLLVVVLLLIAVGLGAMLMIWADEQRSQHKADRPMRPYHMARRKR